MVQFRYRPDIDGLRAVAVVLVILFHAKLGFTGGFAGVDVFFVISGFLITGLILKQQEANTFSLAHFWERRIRRILPAAFVLVAVTVAAGSLFLLPEDFEELAISAVAQQFLLANFYFWRNTGYFAGPAETKALLHTWSLAVEEQFYLGYPFLLVLCSRLTRRATFFVLFCLALASFGLAEWSVRTDPSAAFFLLPARMWELLLGALLVLTPQPTNWKAPWRELCAWTGFAGIITAGLLFDSRTPFPGTAALLPCVGTAFVIYASSASPTSLGNMLSNKKVVFVGLISYSLYLWHWPALALLHYWFGHNVPLLYRMTAIVMSFLCAYLSWRFVETPFRQGFKQVGLKQTATIATVAAVILIGCGLWIKRSRGFPERLPEHVQQLVEQNHIRQHFRTSIQQVQRGELPAVGVERAPNKPIDFLVWGDSHAMAIGELFHTLGKTNGLSGIIAAKPATMPLLGVKRPRDQEAMLWNNAVLQYVRDNEIKNVIFVCRWAVYVDGRSDGRMDTLITDQQSQDASPAEAKAAFRRSQERTLQELEHDGVNVWIMKQVPVQRADPKLQIVQSAFWKKTAPQGISRKTHQLRQANANAVIDLVAKDRAWVNTLDPADHCFNKQDQSKVWNSEGVFYTDDSHLSPLGAHRLLRAMFHPIFKSMK